MCVGQLQRHCAKRNTATTVRYLVLSAKNRHIAAMAFAPDIFRHTPALRNRVIPIEHAEMCFGENKFAEYESQAKAENWPVGWQMKDPDREVNRSTVLSGRSSEDLWVFGCVSLIRDPAVQV